MIEDLKHKFDNLGDEEKIEFMKWYGYAGHDEDDGDDGQTESLKRQES